VTLVHAEFQRLSQSLQPTGSPIACQFNPTEYTLNKGAQTAEIPIPGLDSPLLQFVRGQAETLSADLFFDTTDDAGATSVLPVTEHTDRVYELVKIDPSTHAPPVCRFSWGNQGFPGILLDDHLSQQRRTSFTCIVDSVRQRFTLFNPDGIPLRATLSVTLREYKTLSGQISDLHLESTDLTHAHVVAEGETLSRIAAAVYGDPRRWRFIADANAIVDPLALEPGSILAVPPVV
jgi:Contractile injection system tube protein/LysM domain